MATRAELESALANASAAADAGDLQAAADAMRIANALKAMGGRDHNRPIGQLNKGIANTVGGLVDFINPFDDSAWEGTGLQTGSAVDALATGMNAIGADVATEEPEGFMQSFGRGAGEAAGAILPIMKGLQGLRTAGGAVGAFADDAYKSLASMAGFTAEVAAGGVSQAAGDEVRERGGPEWLAGVAEVAAPVAALPAVVTGAKALGAGAGAVGRATPIGRAVRAGTAALAPYTESGARIVASNRVRDLAGGPERAAELDARIDPGNEFGLTPAQQTGDPNMLALEKLAADPVRNPVLKAELDARLQASRDAMDAAVRDMGGDPTRTQEILEESRQAFAVDLRARAKEAVDAARTMMTGPNREAADNSLMVSAEIERALRAAKLEQNELWGAINKDAPAAVTNGREVARNWVREMGPVGRDHIPEKAERWLLGDNALGDNETIRDTLTLYLDMRASARNARAGVTPDKTKAKIADEIADALLLDLEAGSIGSADAANIKYATNFSRELHEAFDKGAPARLLKRNTNADSYIEPELALEKTVKPGGISGDVAAGQLEVAANTDQTGSAIQDYLRGLFTDAATDGGFNSAAAGRFIAKNRELLKRYPGLKDEITGMVDANVGADDFAKRVETRIAALNDRRQSVVAELIDGPPEKAVSKIFRTRKPVREVKKLVSEAKRDTTGEAVDGVKGLFTDYMMDQPNMRAALRDPRTRAVLGEVFAPDEIKRLDFIGRQMDLAGAKATPDIGDNLSGATANKVIEFVVSTIGARRGAALGAGTSGAALKTASKGSEVATNFVNSLTADRASALLMDAVTDPDLFKSLLIDAASPKFETDVLPRLIPYLVGAGAAQQEEFDIQSRSYMQGVQ